MKKQVSLLTLTAALLLGACSTYEEVPATSGDGATAVGFLADIAPREQRRADGKTNVGWIVFLAIAYPLSVSYLMFFVLLMISAFTGESVTVG